MYILLSIVFFLILQYGYITLIWTYVKEVTYKKHLTIKIMTACFLKSLCDLYMWLDSKLSILKIKIGF
mgnify:CR=1 FL=1